MRRLNLLTAGLLALGATGCSAADAPFGDTLDYSIVVTEMPETAAQIAVTLSFAGESDGTTQINLPSAWGGEESLWSGLEDIHLVDSAIRIENGDVPSARVIHHAPNERITLSYQIIQDWDGIPHVTGGNSYRPIVQPDYVQLIGETVLIYPDNVDAETTVDIDFGIPSSWTLASDLEADELTLQTLLTSIVVAGDFRIETRDVGIGELRVAMRGDWEFEDREFADTVEAVIEANYAYWESPGEDFLVTLIPLHGGPRSSSVGGTGLGDAFAFFATSNADDMTLIQMLTHEHGHTWNPARLGGLQDGMDQVYGYWFSEGFTDFIAQRVGVRAGLWTAANSIESWNQTLAEYAASPVATEPNSAIRQGFWSDGNYQRLPYIRGMIFGAMVDREIRLQTDNAHNLDDVFNRMAAIEETLETASGAFVDQVMDVTGVDISALWTRHIQDGERILLEADSFGSCGIVESFDNPVFEYGMTGHRNDNGQFVLDTIDPDGPAAGAGFVPGMILVERIGGTYGDASVDSVFRTEFDGVIGEHRYRPTSGIVLRQQRIVRAEGNTDVACTRLLAGRLGD
jgi:predicted metalloprotease with PDZ domain